MPVQSKDFNLVFCALEVTMFRSFFCILILHVALSLVMVHAQDDQSDFISIDCGIPEGSKYKDTKTGINYVSDAGFIESGVNHEISPKYNAVTDNIHLRTLRSFPENTRNCYTLKPKQGKNKRYLIRARFVHGNYDSKGQSPPRFDLYLGADLWNTVMIPNPSGQYYYEIIQLLSSDYINICLVNIGQGDPFISAIEVRLLDIKMYEPKSMSLDVFDRVSFGSNQIRYADDKYDRVWYRRSLSGYRVLQTSAKLSPDPLNIPSTVMSTAITPTNSTDNSISYTWDATVRYNYIIYLHFAEVETLEINQKREFNVYLNGDLLGGPISPSANITTLKTESPVTGFSAFTLEINKTEKSTLPPIVNAIEIYIVKQFQLQQTEDQDVGAIWSIKSTYSLKRNWQGDPCVPHAFLWEGLNCNYNDPGAAKIISLNLSSSGLSGEIAIAFANLTMIESLDLSYNNLTGKVPLFVARLDHLRILNLKGNNFTRPLPTELLAKKGLLLSIEGSSDEDKSSKKDKKVGIWVIAPVIAFVMLLIAFSIILIIKRRKRSKDLIINEEHFIPRNQQFTYSDVQHITNNFKTVIGRGGFGTVYHGLNGDEEVAVKMLSISSSQGYKEFQAEVKLLMNVRHKNITSLIGYCNDSSHTGIIYEFMANGDLGKHLFDGSPNILSWERRLQIGCDAAEGLVYMHHGCRPAIVHRDVKCSNILLNESFQAKLADFGLSRAFTTEDATHVSTVIAGTNGYLDPEYYLTNRLTVKSDVYSFGVVLLELITGRRVLSNNINIIEWVKSAILEGNVENIIDPRLQGIFNINTAWKVVELAIACVSYTSIKRPTMNDVAMDLKQCLQVEETCGDKLNNNQSRIVSFDMENVSGPNPR